MKISTTTSYQPFIESAFVIWLVAAAVDVHHGVYHTSKAGVRLHARTVGSFEDTDEM